jgi:hypothetical protein
MSAQLPPCPASLKAIQHYLKTATEHDQRDPVVSYWCKYFMKIIVAKGINNNTHRDLIYNAELIYIDVISFPLCTLCINWTISVFTEYYNLFHHIHCLHFS